MLARILGRTDESDEGATVNTLGGNDTGDPHRPLGHRPRLVEHDRRDLPRLLQDLGALDQDSELGAATGADHQGRRRRETERAGARDDQHGDGGGECGGNVAGEHEPADERRERDPDHDRNEDGRDAIDEALDGRLAGLCLGDEMRDLRESRVGADLRRLDHEASGHVDRRARDVIAGRNLHGDGLTGEHRLIERGAPFDDAPVGGDLLARPDDEQVAYHELVDRHEHLVAVAEDAGVLRAELEESADRISGAAARTSLEVAPEQDQRRDHGPDLEVHVRVDSGNENDRRPCPCSQGADGNQRVHRRGAVACVHERCVMECPAGPEHDRRRQSESNPLPAVELQRWHHREQHERSAQHDRDDEAELQRADPVGLGGVARKRRVVAHGLDGRHEIVDADRARVVGHGRLIGGIVDRRLDAVELVQLPLDPRRTRGAGHALEVEAYPLRLLGRECRHDASYPASSIAARIAASSRSWPRHLDLLRLEVDDHVVDTRHRQDLLSDRRLAMAAAHSGNDVKSLVHVTSIPYGGIRG